MMPPALVLDLLAAVLAGGASPRTALRELAAALESAGDQPAAAALRTTADRMLDPPPDASDASAASGTTSEDALLRAAGRALSLAARTGLPPAELLRAAARRERTRGSAAARSAVRRLEVLLVVPAGVCLLPAFILLSVAPVVIALFGG